MKLTKSFESTIWTNPNPVLRSRHSCFPFACELDDRTLLASHVVEEAFESVDGTTMISKSTDGGRTWTLQPAAYDKSSYVVPRTDYLKLTHLGEGRLLLFGYEYFRDDPECAIGNPETGGSLDDRIVLLRSQDRGRTWSPPEEIYCRWGRHVEASAPILVLKNGDWVTPIAEFPKWDGHFSIPYSGRLLRSSDEGRTWNDDAVTMSLGDTVSVYEQRVCQLEKSGAIVVISWNEDLKTGKRHTNHYSISRDNGRTFEGPYDTGVLAQASSVLAIGGDRLLALHAKRRDTDRPGIYAFIVNLENGIWDVESEAAIWEPAAPVVRDPKMAEIFAFLKFGQPGAIKLSDGDILTTHWCIENGQGRTVAMRFKLE